MDIRVNKWQHWAAAALLGAVACTAADNGVNGPQVPVTLTAVTATTGVKGAASTAVSPAPTVQVSDKKGRPVAGVPVTFAVTAGGGVLAGAVDTTGTDGRATVAGWTMGPAIGLNTLSATVPTLPSVTFSVDAAAGAPATITKLAGDLQTANAGTILPDSLAVHVEDAHGNVVVGAAVTFAVTKGNGTVSAASIPTSDKGDASVRFTLGALAGANEVTVKVGSIAPAIFSETGLVGPPASMTPAAGQNQQVVAGLPVDTNPVVVVRDAVGNPVAGVAVSFAVTQGTGTLGADSTTTASTTTDSAGLASPGIWTLNKPYGVQGLTATATGLTPATFTATSLDPCKVAVPMVLGDSIAGTFRPIDCEMTSNGPLIDFYALTLTRPVFLDLREGSDSTSVDTKLYLLTQDGDTLKANDDAVSQVDLMTDTGPQYGSQPTNSRLWALLGPGKYTVGASTFGRMMGPYTIAVSDSARDVVNLIDGGGACAAIVATPGAQTDQKITVDDCEQAADRRDPNVADYSDWYAVYTTAGTDLTIDVTGNGGFNAIAAYKVNAGDAPTYGTSNGTSSVVTIPSAHGWYYIMARANVPGQLGAYTIHIH